MRKTLIIAVVALTASQFALAWGDAPTFRVGGGLLGGRKVPHTPGMSIGIDLKPPRPVGFGVFSDFYLTTEDGHKRPTTFVGVNALCGPSSIPPSREERRRVRAYFGGGFGLMSSSVSRAFVNGVVGGNIRVVGEVHLFIQTRFYCMSKDRWNTGLHVGVSF